MKRAAIHFLFALFVVLQVNAPLVHAHIGSDSSPAMGHGYDIPSPHTHQADTTSIHADDHSQIVEIGRAIEQRGTLLPEWVGILIALSFILVFTQGTQRVVSLARRPREPDTNYLPSPRAPPSA